MGRHAKNNCANSVFTYEERRKITGWGTAKRRVGSDYTLDYDNCAICLHRAQEPVACNHGHVFCKGCIYEHLLTQKNQFKKQTKAFEEQAKEEEDEIKKKAEEQHLATLEKFDKSESSVTANELEIKRVESASQVPKGYVAVQTKSGTLFKVSPDYVAKQKSERLPCYWIPALAPSGLKEKVNKPVESIMCAVSPHPLRLKQLYPVKFTPTNEKMRDEAKDPKARNVCPSCLRVLTNVTKISMVQTCGHVLCNTCMDTLVKKEEHCVTCGKDCNHQDIIPLAVGGSGFASGGGKVVSSKTAPSFQSF
jgi:nitric oxide synthase-interacting protein